MVTKKVSKLAKTVNAQINPNTAKLIDWKNCDKALTETTSTYASSYANNKKSKDKFVANHPYTLTAHKFGLDLPSNAYVKSVKFLVRMKSNNNKFKSWKPPEARFNIYGGAYNKKYDGKRTVNTSGWEKGIYYVNLSNKNISSSWNTFTYTMNETELKKGGFKANDFNEEVMGLDLKFFNPVFADAKKETTIDVYVAWVKLEIEYEIPTHKITYEEVSLEDRMICVKATFSQSSKADGGTQVLDVDIPWGTELVSPTTTVNGFNPNTRKWTVNAKSGAKTSINFCIEPYLEGEHTLKIGNTATKKFPYDYETPMHLDNGYDDISLSLESVPHKNHRDCLIVAVEGESSDDNVTFSASFNKTVTPIGWTLDSASSGVEVNRSNSTDVMLTVPPNERFKAYFHYCFIPKQTGSYIASVYSDDMDKSKTLPFNVEDAYVYHIGSDYSDGEQYLNLSTDIIKVNTHRVASQIDTDATVIPLRSDEYDAVMHMTPCSLHMKRWDELDYIGCVPLEHLHFDPKSTYKDKLLDSHYKNKRYMGKELASDEDISLNVRLHPHQVTTIQGLIDMDKPIPINANHKCFEGDSLNHRGWCEIYGITTTRTNPHWYKCEIDVKYLTHNLNTRFKIDRGNKVYNQPINDMMSQVFENGDKLADDITQDFFTVQTDGSYMYNTSEVVEVDYLTNEGYEVVKNGSNAQYTDSQGNTVVIGTLNDFVAYLTENNYDVITPTVDGDTVKVKALLDVPNNQRNMFSIDNGQFIDVKTRDTLGTSSEVIFEWSSVVLDEIRENNLERIIELIDKETGQAVFKYQYSDFIYDYDESTDPQIVESVRATPIAYVLKNGDWYSQSEEITLDTVIETGGIIDDTDNATPIDTSVDDEYQDDNTDTSELMIGSTVHFIIDNHKIKVIDEGFNSREFETSLMDLEGESYYWKTVWTNKNSDGESNDIVCFFDFSVSNTIFETQYADKYGKLVVSPFPVSDKNLLFSREAEEGTVYYYEDDLEEFSYLIEPYYQYMNGTDLQTDSGISIFNLNYGYKLVYIQNGLVRMGFDRINGTMYLAKYDAKTGDYITTTHLRLDKYSDINVKSITDDKIEIQASDCIFTIYRGHPYIVVNHSLEDILIDTRYYKVWAEKVGGDDSSEFPVYWDLMNSSNMLTECVGGVKEIRSSCIDVESIDNSDKVATSLTFTSSFNDIEVGTDKTVSLSSANVNLSDVIDVGSGHCSFGDYTFSIGHNYDSVESVSLIGDSPIQSDEVSVLTARVDGYEYTPIAEKSVGFYEKFAKVNVPVGSLDFKDIAVTGSKNDNWYNYLNRMTITTDANGTKLASHNTQNGYYFLNNTATAVFEYNRWRVDFTIVDICDGLPMGWYVQDANGDYNQVQFSSTDVRSGSRVTVTNTDGTMRFYVDGVFVRSVNASARGLHELGFCINSTADGGRWLKYKDLSLSVLDEITTDSDGIASVEVCGGGVGVREFYAQSDSVTSDTVEVIDATAKYDGVSYGSTALVVDNTNGVTRLSTDGTNYGNFVYSRNTSTSGAYYINEGEAFEYTPIGYNGIVRVRLDKSDGTATELFRSDNKPTYFAENSRIRIVHNGTNAEIYLNGEKVQTTNLTENRRLTFKVENGATFTFKDLCVYRLYPKSAVDNVQLTTNKTVLSAYDSETATITATVKDTNNQEVTGQTVEIYKGSSKLGNATETGNGAYTYTYTANGDGDIVLTAKCSTITSDPITIEDLIRYKKFALDGTETTKSFGRGTITVANGELTGKSGYVCGFDNTGDWTLTFDVNHSGYSIVPLVPTNITRYDNTCVQIMSYLRVWNDRSSTDYTFLDSTVKQSNIWQTVKITKINGQYSLYIENTLLATFTWANNYQEYGIGFDAWSGSNSGTIKNIEVRYY